MARLPRWPMSSQGPFKRGTGRSAKDKAHDDGSELE